MAGELMKSPLYSEGKLEDSLVEVFHRMDLMLRDDNYSNEIAGLSGNQQAPTGAAKAEDEEQGHGNLYGADPMDVIKRIMEFKQRYMQGGGGQAGPDSPPAGVSSAGSLSDADSDTAPMETSRSDVTADSDAESADSVISSAAALARAAEAVSADPTQESLEEATSPAAVAVAAASSPATSQQQQQQPTQSGPTATAGANTASGSDASAASSKQTELPEHRLQAGCTAVVAVVKDGQLFVANAGDSRAVLCRNGQAIALSEDHKPAAETERNRIMAAGGFLSDIGGVTRVNGNLNLSRAIGDLKYKGNLGLPAAEQIITAQPDVKKVTIQPDDEFFVLACDGVWDVCSNAEVVSFVKQRLTPTANLDHIAAELLDKCLASNPRDTRGIGCDNMTATIVRFLHEDSEK
jgi:serine/threonine protein phosphatase PrpC